MSGQVDEIKARLDIVEVIGEYIRLKQTGTNWRALCPFHNEKTPSFMASRDKQIWHCFGCSEGGDIFSFVQKIESLEFPEALRLLAQKAGVKLQVQDPQLASQRNRLLDICQLVAAFWRKVLLESPQAQKARDYLATRGVSEKTIADFQLGYAPDSWDVTLNFLKSKGYKDQEIFLAGLTVKKDRGEGFYDRFRDRIMFPINDVHGDVVGFSARALKPEETAKYINTPQTAIYNKSLVVYNLDRAKPAIKKENLAILVEGQMDVVACWQAGTENVIAASGTALTADQIKILKRFTANLALAFDTDSAGESAAKRGIDAALNQEMNVKVIILPQGKDPDECIRKNPADWTAAVKQARSILEYYLEQAAAKFDLQQAEGKKQAAQMLLPVMAKIGNKIEQAHWLQRLAELLNVSEQILRERLPASQSVKATVTIPAAAKQTRERQQMVTETILALALKYPGHLTYLVDSLSPEFLPAGDLAQLYSQLIIYYTEDINSAADNFDYSEFKAKIQPVQLAQLADTLILLAEKDFFDFDDGLLRQELSTMIHFLKKHFYSRRLKELEIKIRQAERLKDQPQLAALAQEFNDLVVQLNLLK